MKSTQQPLQNRIPLLAMLFYCFTSFSTLTSSCVAQSAESDKNGVEFECVATYGETIQSCAQYSHYAFLNQSYTLRVLDIINPAHPAEIFWRRFDQEIESLAIKWPALYLGFRDGDIRILDVSDPAHPRQRASLPCSGRHMDLEIMGAYLLADAGTGKTTDYTVYDIRNPLKPLKRLSGDRQPGSANERNMIFATDGSRLFCTKTGDDDHDADGNCRVTIQELTTSPVTVGRRTIPADEHLFFFVKAGRLVAGDSATSTTLPLAKVNASAWVWGYEYEDGLFTLQEGGTPMPDKVTVRQINREQPKLGIQIFDNATGSSPTLRAIYGGNSGAEQFKIAGDRGFLIDGEDGLQILDMSNPVRPRLLARKTFYDRSHSAPDQSAIPEPVIRAVEDNLVFLTGKDPGFLILDCANPTSPTLRIPYTGPSGPMSIQGKRAYVAADKDGLQILDISNPDAVHRMGSYPTPAPATDLVTSGSLVYLIANDLLVVDTIDPAKPTLVGKTSLSFEGEKRELREYDLQLKRLGAAVYVIALGMGHLKCTSCRVIDVSDSAHPRLMPQQLNAEPPGGGADEDAVPVKLTAPAAKSPTSGWYLCLPSSYYASPGGWDVVFDANLTIFDLGDPFKPTPVFRTNAMQTAERVALYKDTLYLADGAGGLVIMHPSKQKP